MSYIFQYLHWQRDNVTFVRLPMRTVMDALVLRLISCMTTVSPSQTREGACLQNFLHSPFLPLLCPGMRRWEFANIAAKLINKYIGIMFRARDRIELGEHPSCLTFQPQITQYIESDLDITSSCICLSDGYLSKMNLTMTRLCGLNVSNCSIAFVYM